jgi:hypothetical protein
MVVNINSLDSEKKKNRLWECLNVVERLPIRPKIANEDAGIIVLAINMLISGVLDPGPVDP